MAADPILVPARPPVPARTDNPPTRRDSPQAFAIASTLPARSSRRLPRLLPRGTLVDRYRIEELLGIGASAEVYRATHLMLRVPVALKVVPAADRAAVRNLFDEARCAARIEHPNVVRVRDVSRSGDHAFIVMEHVDGRSLSKTVDALGPLSPAFVTSIGIDVAEGLRAGQAKGVVHRDVKPANILLAAAGSAHLVDFGLAYVPSEGDGHVEREGDVVGTHGYMAPEQVKNPRRVDFRADVYALGITMIHALVGFGPRASSASQSMTKRVPQMLVRLLREMIDASPDRRPRSYDVLLTRLRAVLSTITRQTHAD